ncbi:TatABCE protein translocation system subunit [Candidatus Methylobacter favarea]|uniref:Sec-independent protein translocase protein TatC n=1 Tax=Candidatus Methylobacter favarea TaxID=2707345 RepID=A0A8S0XTB0_9GAMM|nr:twin-arginine translocase subunit TatC [Candidatus Methylobacter favarea]CAA9891444.1 TatABCE protein translocation system subunit [Candidatus Methylobacter favarea]
MSPNNSEEAVEQSFISHLIELRNRLLRIVFCVLAVFLALASYANEIYSLLAGPLLKHMPKNSTMIAIDVASPFFTPFKLALVVAVFISIPVILYQFWAFVAPGLYRRERRLILPLLIASTLLFYMGVAFAYFVVFPLVFGFLTTAAPTGVAVMTDITKYLDFVLTLFFAFGICFEVPIFTIVLVWTGLVTPADLADKRPYVIVAAFIIGMVLTPPDAISQTLLAIPMWMLFEIGLLFSRLFVRKAEADYGYPDDVGIETGQKTLEKQEDE